MEVGVKSGHRISTPQEKKKNCAAVKLVGFLIWGESSSRSLMNVFMDFSNPRSKFVLTLNYFKNERFCLSLCLANYTLSHTHLWVPT